MKWQKKRPYFSKRIASSIKYQGSYTGMYIKCINVQKHGNHTQIMKLKGKLDNGASIVLSKRKEERWGTLWMVKETRHTALRVAFSCR